MLLNLDARVKLLLTLAFILALGLSPTGAWPSFVLFAAVMLSMEILSGAPLRYFLTHSVLAAGFALAALPLIFQIEGSPIAGFELWGMPLTITCKGVERFSSILLKSWMSIQAALLLAATTEFPQLLAAMRQLGVPRLMVSIVGLMWRYLYLLRDEALRLMAARSSRSVAAESRVRRPPLVWRAKVTGGMAGSLLLRSLERSERVYAAMLARGYSGEPPAAGRGALRKTDRVWLAGGLMVCGILWLLSLVFGG